MRVNYKRSPLEFLISSGLKLLSCDFPFYSGYRSMLPVMIGLSCQHFAFLFLFCEIEPSAIVWRNISFTVCKFLLPELLAVFSTGEN